LRACARRAEARRLHTATTLFVVVFVPAFRLNPAVPETAATSCRELR
jgi:hypothetical protein